MKITKEYGIIIAASGGTTGGGGVGSLTHSMTNWIQENTPAVSVRVVTTRGNGSVLWSMIRLPICLVQLVILRAMGNYQVLHLQVTERLSIFRKGVLLLAARVLGLKVILHHHGAELIPFYINSPSLVKWLIRYGINAAHFNIVLGRESKDFLISVAKLPSERVGIFMNASSDVRQWVGEESYSKQACKFLMLANLSDRKGVEELLQAAKVLITEQIPLQLVLAGGGEVERFRQRSQALGMYQHCTFTGWIGGDTRYKLLKGTTALVLPSFNEGFPMAIIEALSAGIPVITTPVGSIPDILKDNVTCLFVQAGDISSISAAMHRVITEQSLGSELSINGRQLYEELFGLENYMARIFALYEALLKKA